MALAANPIAFLHRSLPDIRLQSQYSTTRQAAQVGVS
jgi:hypothetical protein